MDARFVSLRGGFRFPTLKAPSMIDSRNLWPKSSQEWREALEKVKPLEALIANTEWQHIFWILLNQTLFFCCIIALVLHIALPEGTIQSQFKHLFTSADTFRNNYERHE